jgi:hypothetical protein
LNNAEKRVKIQQLSELQIMRPAAIISAFVLQKNHSLLHVSRFYPHYLLIHKEFYVEHFMSIDVFIGLLLLQREETAVLTTARNDKNVAGKICVFVGVHPDYDIFTFPVSRQCQGDAPCQIW